MKFDVIVGNPPYNPPAKNGKSGRNILYHKFIRTALKLVKPEGYICYVHPPNWRKPGSKMKDVTEKLMALQFHRLEIYNTKDGMKTFGAGTRYDWYVLQNTPVSRPTPVRDEEGNEVEVDFRDWDWLPNGEFEFIRSLLANNEDEKCPVIYSRTVYETRKKWVSREESEEFCYPLIHATNKAGPRYCWSSRNDRGHFGVAKVIFGDSGINEPVVDLEGKFGLTPHAIGIEVKDAVEARKVKKALMSLKFKRILNLARWSNFMLEWRLFGSFRREWYKEFQDEKG